MSRNPPGPHGDLGHAVLPTGEQRKGQSWMAKEHSDIRRMLRKECKEMKFRFTCGLCKHAAHFPVLGQGLGRHLALHPALLRLVQRFVHACFPGLCCRSPVRGGLVVNSSIVQDLRLKTRDDGSEPWICSPSSPEVTHL